jgi:aminopeptidase-like protein
MLLTAFLAREMMHRKERRKGLRLVWVPETLGAIAYSAMNRQAMKKIRQGFVITCVAGRDGPWGYKQSFNPFHSVNMVTEDVLQRHGIDFTIYPFDIHGSDERQYSSPGLRINTASIHKGRYYEYPFYHSSLDNLDFFDMDAFIRMLEVHIDVLDLLDREPLFRRSEPGGEPMLSRHGAYPATGGGFLPAVKTIYIR